MYYKWTPETTYRLLRTLLEGVLAVLSGLLAQGTFHSPTVTGVVSAIVLFLSTVLMNLEQVPNGKPAGIETDSEMEYNEDE